MNGPADKALDLFKGLVYDEVVKLALSRILAQAAFLSWEPIAFIVTKLVIYLSDKLYEAFSEVVNFEVILLRNEAHHKAFVKAAIELKSVANDFGIDSKEFRESREIQKRNLSKFVRFAA